MLLRLHAHHLARVPGLVVLRRHPVGVDGRVVQGLLVLGVELTVVPLRPHLELVDGGVAGVDDVQPDHGGRILGLAPHLPLELRLIGFAAGRAEGEEVQRRLVPGLVVHEDGPRARGVVAVAVLRLHPVGVGGVLVLQRLAVGENVGALLALRVHLEVVGHAVVRVLDVQRGLRHRIGADHRRDPHEAGLVGGALGRRDVQEGDVQLTFVIDVVVFFFLGLVLLLVVLLVLDRRVVAGVAAAGLIALAVVPAPHGEVVETRQGLGALRLLLVVERHVEVRTLVLLAGLAVDVAGVADRAQGVRVRELFADGHVDLGQVAVAAHEAVAVVDEDVVAVALVSRAVFGAHLQNRATRHGSHVLAVGLAAGLREVQGVGVVAVGEAPVLVGAGVLVVVRAVALGEDPVLARLERDGQFELTPAHAVAGVFVDAHVGFGVFDQGALQAAPTRHHEGQKAPPQVQHDPPPLFGCVAGH